jgi:hypothetical protein
MYSIVSVFACVCVHMLTVGFHLLSLQIDRARGIFVHASAVANPATANDFWDAWKLFEVRHGNEDTFREMLRIKRWAEGGHGLEYRGAQLAVHHKGQGVWMAWYAKGNAVHQEVGKGCPLRDAWVTVSSQVQG